MLTTTRYLQSKAAACVSIAVFTGFLASSAASASTVSGGALTLNLDENVFASFYGGSDTAGGRGLYVEEFLNQSYNTQTITATSPDPTPGTGPIPSTTGLQFAVNGPSIASTPGSGRTLQATNLSFADDPATGTGQIGLSGALRLRSDFAFGGYLAWQELSLSYDASRINAGGFGESGWVIKTNQPGFGSNALFDLTNVSSSITAGLFNLSGNIIISPAWGSGFLGIPDGSQVGTINLQTAVVPIPAAAWLFGSWLLGLMGIARRNNRAIA